MRISSDIQMAVILAAVALGLIPILAIYGYRLQAEVFGRSCPIGHLNPGNARYCRQCGEKIKA